MRRRYANVFRCSSSRSTWTRSSAFACTPASRSAAATRAFAASAAFDASNAPDAEEVGHRGGHPPVVDGGLRALGLEVVEDGGEQLGLPLVEVELVGEEAERAPARRTCRREKPPSSAKPSPSP